MGSPSSDFIIIIIIDDRKKVESCIYVCTRLRFINLRMLHSVEFSCISGASALKTKDNSLETFPQERN